MNPTPNHDDEATEAAQNVVDHVTSWEYSAERDTVETKLDRGLDEAGVELGSEERTRVLDEIEQVKADEGRGTPAVERARPSSGAPDQSE